MTALSVPVAAAGGSVCALGVLLVGYGITANRVDAGSKPASRRQHHLAGLTPRRLAGLIAAPVLTLAVTGWPVLAGFAALAVLALPRLLAGRRTARHRLERLAALADWSRRLSGVLIAGAGLEHAIAATTPTAPASIAGPVSRLTGRLSGRHPTRDALHAFADELADHTADLLVAALLLAADRRGRGLARILERLADTIETEVDMRRQIDADRATPRTTARYVTAITLITAGLLIGLRRSYVAPFSTTTGQLVLLLWTVPDLVDTRL